MKFLKSEYDSVKSLIEKNKLIYEEFTFVKSRGMLNINWTKKQTSFSFYRKKETKINDQMQFEDSLTYLLGKKKDKTVDSWDEVLVEFQKFLNS